MDSDNEHIENLKKWWDGLTDYDRDAYPELNPYKDGKGVTLLTDSPYTEEISPHIAAESQNTEELTQFFSLGEVKELISKIIELMSLRRPVEIRLLAAQVGLAIGIGDKNQHQIAAEFNVSQPAISKKVVEIQQFLGLSNSKHTRDLAYREQRSRAAKAMHAKRRGEGQ